MLIEISRPEVLNSANERLHWELSQIFKFVDRDPDCYVSVITGQGRAFCSGGDFEMLEEMSNSYESTMRQMRDARELVYSLILSEKPIISAINGPAVGAGLAVALLSDISIADKKAVILDGHINFGVTPGDHAVLYWPLAMGMPKAKKFLMTGEQLTGEKAYEIGLVSELSDENCVKDALTIAQKLRNGPQLALRSTKRCLNLLLVQNFGIFEASLAHEMLGFLGEDAKSGIEFLMKKSDQPIFNKTLGKTDRQNSDY